MAELFYIQSPFIFVFKPWIMIHNVQNIIKIIKKIDDKKLKSLINSYGNVNIRFDDLINNYRFKKQIKVYELLNIDIEDVDEITNLKQILDGGYFMFPKDLEVFDNLPKGLQFLNYNKNNGYKYFYDENNNLITSYV